MPQRRHIPWAEPKYWGNEERYALEALRSSWISGGPFVERLEAELATQLGSPHVVATSNGTTAIHAAYLAMDVRPGDEIVVPGFAFMAGANIALHMGARPVFADVDPETWCVTAETIARVLTPRTRGLVPVHTYGNVCDMQPILDLARERGLWVIEDAAEAFGSTYRGQQAGTLADIGTFSFHATKTITTGEGGAVATRKAELCDRLHLYRSHGVKSVRYFHDVPGHNFRLTNVQAAIGCGQIEQLAGIRSERERVYRQYVEALAGANGLQLQRMTAEVEPIVWAVGVRLDEAAFPQGRDEVMSQMAKQGVETRPGFYPASAMPHLYGQQQVPESARLGEQVISLPSSPTVTEEEIGFIAERLRSLVGTA
jgi:perosamine synthetase